MIDEQLEHEYCELWRKTARKYGVRVDFDFEANNETVEGHFSVHVHIWVRHRQKIARHACIGIYALSFLAGIPAALYHWTVLQVVCHVFIVLACIAFVFIKRLFPEADYDAMASEVRGTWNRRHPEYLVYNEDTHRSDQDPR